MTSELFIPFKDNKYREGLFLNEYNGKFYIVQAQKSKNGGTVFKKFCCPIFKDTIQEERKMPMGVQLKDRKEAIEIITKILSLLEGR